MKPILAEYNGRQFLKRHAVTDMKQATELYRKLAAEGRQLLLECDGVLCACTWDVSRRKDPIMSIRHKRPVYCPKHATLLAR